MLIVFFVLLLVLGLIAGTYGFAKANIAIFLLGASMLCLTGAILINDGITYGTPTTFNYGDGSPPVTVQPQHDTIKDSTSLLMMSNTLFYGGFVLIAFGLVLPLIGFINKIRT